jgi:hypothetical protein
MIDYSIIASTALGLSIFNLGIRFWDRRKQSSPSVSDSTTPVASVPAVPGSVVVCSQCGRRVVRASGTPPVCANCLK